MIQVTLDTVPESHVHLSAQRLRIVRGARVSGLDLTAIGTPANALTACLAAAGLPALGDAHPARPAARVTEHFLRGLDADSVEVGIVYVAENPAAVPFRFRVGTSLAQEATQVDKDGQPLLVSYRPAGLAASVPATQRLVGAQKLEPLSSLVAFGTLASSPGALSRQFTGTVNAAPWQGGAARTWLCTGIEGEQSESALAAGDAPFHTTFTFLYRARTWDATVVYADANGQTPPDLNPADLDTSPTANGLRRARLYPETDFSQLPF